MAPTAPAPTGNNSNPKYGVLRPSSRNNPCPSCGRTKDGDCRISANSVICHRGQTHHPPEGLRRGDVIDGKDGQRWAYTGESKDGRAAVFTLDRPLSSEHRPPTRRPLKPSKIDLARLPEPITGIGSPYAYSSSQRVRRIDKQSKKNFVCEHHDGSRWRPGAGPGAWPAWHEADAITHGRGKWIIDIEGEKCAGILLAAGVVAITQPGHAHKPEQIQPRYERLQAADVAGVVFLADNDDMGANRAEQARQAAAAIGMELMVLPAVDVWPGLPNGGSIDDAPGTAVEQVEALAAAINNRSAACDVLPTITSASDDDRRHRLRPDEVVELLPKRLGRLRLNVRTGDVLTETEVLSTNQIGRLYLQLSSRAESWPKEPTADAVALLASQDHFDPVAEYLDAIEAEPLPMGQWERLDQHLLGIDDPIAAAFLPRYLVSAVARVFQPGCSIRQTPVLVGPQWRGKTALGRELFGATNWVEGIGELSRDDLMKAHTAWGVELAELDGVTRRADQERLKAFLTETCDTYRKPYDRAPERHERRFVFWATSNGPPLRDATGSTRFVVIALPDRMLPIEWVVEHRDAIWARAVEQYRSGIDWDACSEAERQAIAERNSNHQEIDPWAETITPQLERWAVEQPLQPVLYQQLYRWLDMDSSRQNNATTARLRALMLSAGWIWDRRRQGEQRHKGWWPPSKGGHTGHTPGTPRCTQGNASAGLGSAGGGHTGHTNSTKGEKRGTGGAGARACANTSSGFAVPAVPTAEIDRTAVDLHGHTDPVSLCPALCPPPTTATPIGSGYDVIDDGDDPAWGPRPNAISPL